MLSVRIQAIDGKRTFTFLDSRPCRLLQGPTFISGTARCFRIFLAQPRAVRATTRAPLPVGAARSSHGQNNWFRPPPVRGRRAATDEFPPPPGAAVDSFARRSHRAAHAAPIPPEIRSGKSLSRRAPHRNENPPAPAPASPPGTP